MSDSQPQTQSFQAEVRQLLDIVIHSLYTDKEIFVRELISNASDSLEKLRLKQLTENKVFEADLPLEITITTDEEAGTITFADHGIGMNRQELTDNLGTIARSGSKEFLEALKEKGDSNASVIGQFGVGFYSVFMAAEKVEVFTHSWDPEAESLQWDSDGQTGYTIQDADAQQRGAKIVVYLKEDSKEFATEATIKKVIEQYSRFVSFPLNLNGERVNTVEAIWLKSKKEITEEEYKEFYQYCAHAADEPRHTLHFSADAPININALLFSPDENHERFGFGQMKSGVSLYCRKVLIDAEPQGLLPEWLRFLRGVVDSEDLPLNLSRETMQDSALVQKLNRLLTKRFLKHLATQAKNEPEKFQDFFERFGRFLKEGIATAPEHHEALAGLLRFESSLLDKGEKTSFADYHTRAKEEQEEIYYLVGLDRDAMMEGPYLEAFQKRGIEVILFTDSVDDYILESLREFKGKKLVSADRAEIALDDLPEEKSKLSEEDSKDLVEWLTTTLGEKVEKVELGKRLVSHPVVALQAQDAPSGQVRAMMEAMGENAPEQKARLEFNPSHELVAKLHALKNDNPEVAAKVANQLADNALLAAGLVKNPAGVVAGMNELLGSLMK
ncbi:molecular chaperone HtpG [Akkermansiaceae bacterium]|nr:molecular chaperone HtpG [Akkermansiaceae bacterium]MDA7519672.1 molecular chaperone HtpG [bacterium]MDA7517329.1 molecular chaperone HtpG [Akkermansiaceae bacterium]MDA7862327.1 molecular chaperone HtpG [Akkermansiaceae bacterium]MDA7931547.1 molecular chaperone HtpG [Akkermansiaceae bacterium]